MTRYEKLYAKHVVSRDVFGKHCARCAVYDQTGLNQHSGRVPCLARRGDPMPELTGEKAMHISLSKGVGGMGTMARKAVLR
jgi:hypothetical protein